MFVCQFELVEDLAECTSLRQAQTDQNPNLPVLLIRQDISLNKKGVISKDHTFLKFQSYN
jgi:hypothetical protein